MIWTNKFTIGHIGRTGGDAVIFLMVAAIGAGSGTGVPLGSNLKVTAVCGDEKHRPFNGEELLRVLGIRRLPAFILSIRHHQMAYARVEPWSSDFCSKLKNGDNELARITVDNKYSVDRWLRCEYLRDDICTLLTDSYGDRFTYRMKAALYSATTKAPLPYNRNIYDFFSEEQLKTLYNVNPVWAALEKKLYGSILY